MSAAFVSIIGLVAGIVHEPGATLWLFATSGILLPSTILSVLASIAAQHLLRLMPAEQPRTFPKPSWNSGSEAPDARFKI